MIKEGLKKDSRIFQMSAVFRTSMSVIIKVALQDDQWLNDHGLS
jgi:hypothetical protein